MEDPKNGEGEEGMEENCVALLVDHTAIKQEPRDDEEQVVDVSEPDLATNVEIMGVDEELNFTLVDEGFVLGADGEVESEEVASKVAPIRLQILEGFVLGAIGEDEEVESQEVSSAVTTADCKIWIILIITTMNLWWKLKFPELMERSHCHSCPLFQMW